jgi:hypothetical protein
MPPLQLVPLQLLLPQPPLQVTNVPNPRVKAEEHHTQPTVRF